MNTKKVVLIVAHNGYQPVEYGVPKEILQKAGYTVLTASNKAGTATAKDLTTTAVDSLITDIDINDVAGIFFIGGPGALEHLDIPDSYTLINKALEHNVALGAICVSTRILAKSHALKQRSATGWNEDNQLEDIYKDYFVNFIDLPAVIDGKIVTARDPKAAKEFADGIIRVIEDEIGFN